jgi:DNA modification methylase
MSSPESFLDGKVTLHRGDCLEVLPLLEANSIDSCVTDPPYGLSFMGRGWDAPDNVAFRPETWAEVLRVLKPGAHLIAFSGTRTYHRMACAIEDAGFEIRDQIGWCYGSGFPKSHDVSKGIDKRGGEYVGWFGPWLRAWREKSGTTQKQIAALFPSKTGGLTGCVANWELGLNMPTPEQFNSICTAFNLPFASLEEAEREIIGQHDGDMGGLGGQRLGNGGGDITRPASVAACQWQGWGTALKPAWEPIVLARKPLSESSIAANVLRWGVGAININGCRIWADTNRMDTGCSAGMMAAENTSISLNTARSGKTQTDQCQKDSKSTTSMGTKATTTPATSNSSQEPPTAAFTEPNTLAEKNGSLPGQRPQGNTGPGSGRWPANLIHDGSEEVLAGFPETGVSAGGRIGNAKGAYTGIGEAGFTTDHSKGDPGFGDSGSAARFFYTAKADADDRLGSKHPTVKPIDLIQYLVRLITPAGGVVIDPFAGTGTCGEAAFREGMAAVLVEREQEYQADIVKRMGLCLSGPEQRRAASVKQLPPDDLPMFGGGI